MNNDDAMKREDCEPKYLPVKGFQPLRKLQRKVINRGGHKSKYYGTSMIKSKYTEHLNIICFECVGYKLSMFHLTNKSNKR